MLRTRWCDTGATLGSCPPPVADTPSRRLPRSRPRSTSFAASSVPIASSSVSSWSWERAPSSPRYAPSETTARPYAAAWPIACGYGPRASTAGPPTRSAPPAGRVGDGRAPSRQLRLGPARRPFPPAGSSRRDRERARGGPHRGLPSFPPRGGILGASRGGSADLLEELLALPVLHIDETIVRRAVQAQGQLARAAHHRVAARRPHPRRGSRTGTTSASSTTTPTTTSSGRGPTCGSRACGLRRAGACEERCRASRASRTPHGCKFRTAQPAPGSASRTKNSTSGQDDRRVRHPGSSSRCPRSK